MGELGIVGCLVVVGGVVLGVLILWVLVPRLWGHRRRRMDSNGLVPPAGHLLWEKAATQEGDSPRHEVTYRTKSGKYRFKFSIEQIARGAWRVFILEQPDYGNRSDDAHITHRLSDYGTGRRYVCWDSPIRTVDDAVKIAVAWAEGTEAYIQYGKHF